MMSKHNELLRLTSLIRANFPSHRDFNVFQALQLESDEVRLHSRLIAFLVNPQAHAHGARLLHLFLNTVGISVESEDTCRNARVVTEEGRVDILISFGRRRAILIENKIYASDRENQLVAYWRLVRRHYNDVHVLYLTLQGMPPSDQSLKGLDVMLKDRYQVISYKSTIRDWLFQSEQSAVRVPQLRETINQYAAVVDRLTGSVHEREYMEELIKLLLTADHLRLARDIRAAYVPALVTLQQRMWTELLDITKQTHPDMAKNLTLASLPDAPSARDAQIRRFYQPNARDRRYYGLYFSIDNYEHAVAAIEIESGLYTGIYCPEDKKTELRRVTTALEAAGVHGETTSSWPRWRQCALTINLDEPDEVALDLLNDPVALREAAESTVEQVYVAWRVAGGHHT